MAQYLGRNENNSAQLDDGDQISLRFDVKRHAAIAKPVKAYLALHRKFANAMRAVDAALAREEAARQALAEADTLRDDATLQLDRVLIGGGAPKANSFKAFGGAPPAKFIDLAVEKQTAAVKALTTKILKAKPDAKVAAAVKRLVKANDAVAPKEAKLKAAESETTKARRERDAMERPLRRALSVLKLRARIAELEGATGIYDELFATEARHEKKEPLLPDSAPTPPVA
jgi:hypothetical protein